MPPMINAQSSSGLLCRPTAHHENRTLRALSPIPGQCQQRAFSVQVARLHVQADLWGPIWPLRSFLCTSRRPLARSADDAFPTPFGVSMRPHVYRHTDEQTGSGLLSYRNSDMPSPATTKNRTTRTKMFGL